MQNALVVAIPVEFVEKGQELVESSVAFGHLFKTLRLDVQAAEFVLPRIEVRLLEISKLASELQVDLDSLRSGLTLSGPPV